MANFTLTRAIAAPPEVEPSPPSTATAADAPPTTRTPATVRVARALVVVDFRFMVEPFSNPGWGRQRRSVRTSRPWNARRVRDP